MHRGPAGRQQRGQHQHARARSARTVWMEGALGPAGVDIASARAWRFPWTCTLSGIPLLDAFHADRYIRSHRCQGDKHQINI